MMIFADKIEISHSHVALDHQEQLPPCFHMEVCTSVRASNKHNRQLILVHQLVADGWDEAALVVFGPDGHVAGLKQH